MCSVNICNKIVGLVMYVCVLKLVKCILYVVEIFG